MPIASAVEVAPSLPTPRTSLVGRERDLAAARSLLLDEAVPLLTLTGLGGVGKTRLALAVAHEVAGAFADGTGFVDLAPIHDADLVVPTVAQVFGVRASGDRPLAEQLAAFLRARQTLLVLDNFEQVLAAAPAVAELLAACPALQVLATSRAPLRIRGEHRLPVEPLPVPSADPPSDLAALARTASVSLFLARARAVDPSFALTEANAAAVAEICRRLDGLPLAVELAAARLRVLSPPALLALFDKRFRELAGGPRDAPARQQTLRDALDWSHDLLAPEAQTLFRRVSVFVGGFDLDATADIAGAEVIDSLAELTDQGLLRPEDIHGTPRFGMLETVREFALERLTASGEETAMREAHARAILAFAERADAGLRGPEQGQWLARLVADDANLRAALDWATGERDSLMAVRLASTLAMTWGMRGQPRGARRWLEEALNLPPAAVVGEGALLRAVALNTLGNLAFEQGEFERARAPYHKSLALFRQAERLEGVAVVLNNLAAVAQEQGALREARAHFEETVAIRRNQGDRRRLSPALSNAGYLALLEDDHERAVALLEEALAIAEAEGDARGIANATTNLGELAYAQGRRGDALASLERGLALLREVGDRRGVAIALVSLGRAALDDGELGRAATVLAETLALQRELEDRGTLADLLEVIASHAVSVGRSDRAVRLLGGAEALREASGSRRKTVLRPAYERTVSTARMALDEPSFADALAAGRERPLVEILAEAEAEVAETEGPRDVTMVAAPQTDPLARYGLSLREREVLALLARRLTDKEVAAALFLSPHTVHRHTTNLFAKLGVANRREAAALAARLGLA